jgi:hypothetical protein
MFLSKGQCDHKTYTWLCVNVCGSAVKDGCRNEEKLVKWPAISIRIGIVVFCQAEVSASGWSPFQRSSAGCGVPECDSEASIMRVPGPLEAMKNMFVEVWFHFINCCFFIIYYCFIIINFWKLLEGSIFNVLNRLKVIKSSILLT